MISEETRNQPKFFGTFKVLIWEIDTFACIELFWNNDFFCSS